jgi:hypothetical protein
VVPGFAWEDHQRRRQSSRICLMVTNKEWGDRIDGFLHMVTITGG